MTSIHRRCCAYLLIVIQYIKKKWTSRRISSSGPTSQQTPTSLVCRSSCSFEHNKNKKGEEREERTCGLSEASHYYGNIAHRAQDCTDTGCHGYTVTALAKEWLHMHQRGARRRELSTLYLQHVSSLDKTSVLSEKKVSQCICRWHSAQTLHY